MSDLEEMKRMLASLLEQNKTEGTKREREREEECVHRKEERAAREQERCARMVDRAADALRMQKLEETIARLRGNCKVWFLEVSYLV